MEQITPMQDHGEVKNTLVEYLMNCQFVCVWIVRCLGEEKNDRQSPVILKEPKSQFGQ
jgi:hypothetical protein